jgi:hypothetical protein
VRFGTVLVDGDLAEIRPGRPARDPQIAGGHVQLDFRPGQIGGAVVGRHLAPLAGLAGADHHVALVVGIEQPQAGQVLRLAQIQIDAERELFPVFRIQLPRRRRLAGRRPDNLPLFVDDARRVPDIRLVDQHGRLQFDAQLLSRSEQGSGRDDCEQDPTGRDRGFSIHHWFLSLSLSRVPKRNADACTLACNAPPNCLIMSRCVS